ncbi:MAG: ROK family protein, partial [Anaerolineaceae bacterium]|nr:ROK family protein [Anaerolineaceae bacterium]
MNTYISIDVGGTQIRVAVYPAEGIDPLRIKKIATKGIGTAVERIIATVKELWRKEENVKAIAICVPGPVDPEAGIIFTAANVPEWNNIPLRDILQNEFHVPVFLGNDANLAALAEWQFGAGRGHRNLIYLTISTGVGGGVIMDGNLLLGYRGLGAELGHVIVQPDGAMCGCGNRGHIESYSSGTGIANFVKEQLATGRASSLANEEKITAKEVAKAAKAGDELAL